MNEKDIRGKLLEIQQGRCQINYIITKQRFRNQIKQCKAYPGADIKSDHSLIIIESEFKYKNIKKKNNITR